MSATNEPDKHNRVGSITPQEIANWLERLSADDCAQNDGNLKRLEYMA